MRILLVFGQGLKIICRDVCVNKCVFIFVKGMSFVVELMRVWPADWWVRETCVEMIHRLEK